MKLHQLPTTTTPSKKRLGRGYGSGQGGHTSTRGQKGQKSRSKVKMWFEGGQLPLTKKLPFLRGKDRFKSVKVLAVCVNLDQLNRCPAGSTVTADSLAKLGIISTREAATRPIKILARGTINHPLTIQGLILSQAASQKIQASGGTVSQ